MKKVSCLDDKTSVKKIPLFGFMAIDLKESLRYASNRVKKYLGKEIINFNFDLFK